MTVNEIIELLRSVEEDSEVAIIGPDGKEIYDFTVQEIKEDSVVMLVPEISE